MINGNFKIKIVSHSNEIIIEKDIIKYCWLTENRIEVFDSDNNRSIYHLASFLMIIEEIKNNEKYKN